MIDFLLQKTVMEPQLVSSGDESRLSGHGVTFRSSRRTRRTKSARVNIGASAQEAKDSIEILSAHFCVCVAKKQHAGVKPLQIFFERSKETNTEAKQSITS